MTREESVKQAVGLIERTETDNSHVYAVYADITEHFGLRRLLLSVLEQIATHLEGLQSLVGSHFPTEVFDVDELTYSKMIELELPRSVDAAMEYRDFLRILCNRQQAVASMYRLLHAAATSPDSKQLCSSFEIDSMRSMTMARDRYELELMMEE